MNEAKQLIEVNHKLRDRPATIFHAVHFDCRWTNDSKWNLLGLWMLCSIRMLYRMPICSLCAVFPPFISNKWVGSFTVYIQYNVFSSYSWWIWIWSTFSFGYHDQARKKIQMNIFLNIRQSLAATTVFLSNTCYTKRAQKRIISKEKRRKIKKPTTM